MSTAEGSAHVTETQEPGSITESDLHLSPPAITLEMHTGVMQLGIKFFNSSINHSVSVLTLVSGMWLKRPLNINSSFSAICAQGDRRNLNSELKSYKP